MTNMDLFNKALAVGRPPNIKKLFPNSRALIVSGQFIDRAMLKKGHAMTIAANGRNGFVIRGALKAAQKANAPIIIEIAKSEGGSSFYCAINYWNMARFVDAACNELGITVPVAVHADHYAIKNEADLEQAKTEIPSMFEAGITSIAIDASHLPEDLNLLINLELLQFVPEWAGYETEVGEIKGDLGLSTANEALFQISGLNAMGKFPDWIALNNGTVHGLEPSAQGIHVELTHDIHEALKPYGVSGAQHGTSGNSSERLKAIAAQTRTTKANVATALQMISWGVAVNEYGNAILDADGNFSKIPDKGMSRQMWDAMVAYAAEKGWKKGDYKKLNAVFENKLWAQPQCYRERMENDVADFVYDLLVNVFNAENAADLALEIIVEANGYMALPKAKQIVDPNTWSPADYGIEPCSHEHGFDCGKGHGAGGDFDD